MFKFFDGIGKALWGTVDFLTAVREANKLKADPERCSTSFRFAVRAMLCGFSMLFAAVFAGVLIMIKLFSIPALNLALGIALGVGAVMLLAHTLKNWFLQLSINKSRWTWVSLGFVVFCILGSVAILVGFSFI